MTPQNYSTLFIVLNVFIFLYYELHKNTIKGIFHMTEIHFYNVLLSLFVGIYTLMTPELSDTMQFILFGAVGLTSFFLSFLSPFKARLHIHLEKYWFNCCLWLFFSFLLVNLLTLPYRNYDGNLVTPIVLILHLLPLIFIFLMLVYFSMIQLRYYTALRKQKEIEHYIKPLYCSLNHELEDFKRQLVNHQESSSTDVLEASAPLIETLNNKIHLAKLPVYSNHLAVSMAILTYLNDQSKENTWIDTQATKLPSEELAFILNILCQFLSAKDPNAIKGIQRTPYTSGHLIFSLDPGILTSKQLQSLIKKGSLGKVKNGLADYRFNLVCLNWLMHKRQLSLRYTVTPEDSIDLVLSGL